MMEKFESGSRYLTCHLQEIVSPQHKHLTEVTSLHSRLSFNIREKADFTKILIFYQVADVRFSLFINNRGLSGDYKEDFLTEFALNNTVVINGIHSFLKDKAQI